RSGRSFTSTISSSPCITTPEDNMVLPTRTRDPTCRENYSPQLAHRGARVRPTTRFPFESQFDVRRARAGRAMLQRSMNVEAVIRTVVRELVVKRDFRLPLHIATL